MGRIGVRALQQNASAVLRRVKAGERIEVAERGRGIALLVPLPKGGVRSRLAESGRLTRAIGDLLVLGAPLPTVPPRISPSRRLKRMRAQER